MEPIMFQEVMEVYEKLNKQYEAYFVGGCVRDFLMGRVPHDYDISTDATPDQVIEVFGRENCIEIGKRFGTIAVKTPVGNVEITSFRGEQYKIGSRNPEVKFGVSLYDDLSRRDFTMNAIAWAPGRGLIDPFGGASDIEFHLIRAVGNPIQRFQEDGLRILRGLRFSAQLDFKIEPLTQQAMRDEVARLDDVSGERIVGELDKLFAAKHWTKINWCNTPLDFALRRIFPELDRCVGVDQNNRYHHQDVFYHTMRAFALSYCQQNSQLLLPDEWNDKYVRWALLLHDIGKPAVKSTDVNGYDHFYGHSKYSAELAGMALRRLHMDKKSINIITQLVEFHDMEIMPTPKCARRLLNKFGEEQVKRLLMVRQADNRAHTPEAWKKFDERIIPFYHILEYVIQEEGEMKLSDLAINGYHIMALGVTGKKIGIILDYLFEKVVAGELENNEVELMAAAERLIENL